MKVAIVLSGHLRSYKNTLQNFNDFVNMIKSENHEVKIFCHTWSELEANTSSWWGKSEVKESVIGTIENEIINAYNPASFIIENSDSIILEKEFEFYKSNISFEGVQLMYYSLNESFEILREYELNNNWQSDLVIRSRYDILLDFDQICLKTSNMMIPISSNFDIIGGISDVFALLPRNQMDLYSQQYVNFCNKDILKKYFDKYALFVPELFLLFLIKGVNYLPIKGTVKILRLNGNEIIINFFSEMPIIANYFYNLKLDKEIISFDKSISYYFKEVYPKRSENTNSKELKLFVDSLLIRFRIIFIFKLLYKNNSFIEFNTICGIQNSQSIIFNKIFFKILIKIRRKIILN
jgi:hypothetical protein